MRYGKDKLVAVMTAMAGLACGEIAQYILRACITPFGPNFITTSVVFLAETGYEFDDKGLLISERYVIYVITLIDALRAEITLKIA